MSKTTPTWFEINEIVKEFVPERLRIEATNRIWDKISHLEYRISDLFNENTKLVKKNLDLNEVNESLTSFIAGGNTLIFL